VGRHDVVAGDGGVVARVDELIRQNTELTTEGRAGEG
jgi:hypothetical protein